MKSGHPIVPALCYAPIVAFWVAWNAVAGKFETGWWALQVASGLAAWTIIEYLMHRFLFHYPSSSQAFQQWQAGMHLLHHDEPDDPEKIIARPSFSMPIAIGIWASLGLALGWEQASMVACGIVFGYLAYEVVHYRVHTRQGGGPILRFWRRYHFYHHFKNPARAFGVTSPVWDVVFRTSPKG